ncbi:acyltransferase domain-containing protein, partial [Streptomyces sp. NPDC127117]|uniref:acyltransferase domain-containing protein n=1 Tax=Streptomyces sp. NPDC127117 TaxID=3345368 RepID=UPI00363A23AA
SNIGHTQAAAGVAGIIKMIMSMRHGVMPRTLHIDQPSTHVDWTTGAVELLTEPRTWDQHRHPRRAAVSSFGISGTNAHVIIEEVLAENPIPAVVRTDTSAPVVPWVLSAKTRSAMATQARELYARLLSRPDLNTQDVAYSLATSRSALEYRTAVVGSDRAELLEGVKALAEQGMEADAIGGRAHPGSQVGFLFSGQGSQRAGMGRELYDTYPVFADAFDAVCAELDRHLDQPVKGVVFGGSELIDQTVYTQAGLFAIEVALFRLLEHWGVTPDYLLGHSIGELAAAHVAGVWSLEDAAALVAARGRLMQALPTGGAMIAIQATETEVLPLLTDSVSIAALNGPDSVVISGDEEAVLAIASGFGKTKQLRVSHAFHSPRMEPMLTEFKTVAENLTFHAPKLPIVSNLTGEIAGEELLTADYWVDHVRQAVRFLDGVRHLETQGVTTYLELGPGGVLSAMGQDCISNEDATFVPALRKNRTEPEALTTALAELHVRGTRIDWAAYYANTGAQRVDLPTYAFQHQRFWPKAPVAGGHPGAAGEAPVADSAFWEAVAREDLSALVGGRELTADSPLSEVLPVLSSWHSRQQQRSVADGWRYRVTWKPVQPSGGVLSGRWLLALPEALSGTAVVEWCEHGLKAAGAEVVRVTGATDLSEYADAAGVLSLLGLAADETLDEGVAPGLAATLELVRKLGGAGVEAPLWCLTQGAVSTGTSDPLRNAAQTQVWGLGRVVALEHPKRWGGLIDLPESFDARTWEQAVAVLSGTSGEDQVALRSSGVLVSRLLAAAVPPGDREWAPRGTVLIGDGTTPLAGHLAGWLAGTAVERVVLLAPAGSAPDPDVLAELGERAVVRNVDVTDREQLTSLASELAADGAPVRAVVHTSGTSHFAPVTDTDPAQLTEALRARAAGAAALDAVFAETELDAFVLFSSIAGVWGGGGQGAYAAGTAYLDGLAQLRRARGLAATSVAWGPWAGGDTAVPSDAPGDSSGSTGSADPADGNGEEQMRRRGLLALEPAQALSALARAVAEESPVLTVADMDWGSFARAFTALRPSPLLADLPDVARIAADAAASEAENTDVSDELRQRLAVLPEPEQEAELVELIRRQAASVLGYASVGDIEAGRAFREMGFDSLMAVELRNRLTRATGLRLPAGFVFDYPNAIAAARLLRQDIFRDGAASGDSLLTELDKLEASLVTSEPDALTRTRVAVRLQAFLAKWQGEETESSAAEGGVLGQLESASDDELLNFINREMGR